MKQISAKEIQQAVKAEIERNGLNASSFYRTFHKEIGLNCSKRSFELYLSISDPSFGLKSLIKTYEFLQLGKIETQTKVTHYAYPAKVDIPQETNS